MPEPSNFELARRIDDVRDEVRAGMRDVAANISRLQFVSIDRYVAEQETMRQRVIAIEHDNAELRADAKWNRRTLIGAVCTIVVQLIVGAVWLAVNGIGGTP
jgi:hypothetical protein